MKKINFKNIFSKTSVEVGFVQSFMSRERLVRDWKIITLIFTAGLLLLTAFAWQIYLDDDIGGGYLPIEELAPTDPVNSMDNKRLQKNILQFETRLSDYASTSRLENNKPVDPSI